MSVRIQHVEKSFPGVNEPIRVLKNISLTIEKGAIIGIIGRSGAGKSTLLRCINGLSSPDRGEILIDGESITHVPEQKRQLIQQRIGNVFQSFNLLSRRTALENVLLPLEFMGNCSKENEKKAKDLLALVGLQGKEGRYPFELSGGQCQRVSIARALIADSNYLLCDEFTSALDPETSLEILALLRDLNQRLGVTVILITHDMNVVREICDRVCVLDQGEVVEEGTISEVLLHGKHSVTRSMISSLFNKELPQIWLDVLEKTPTIGSAVVVRLLFSGKAAQKPIIADLIGQFKVPINIISGNLDHIREHAFGCLIFAMPYVPQVMNEMLAFVESQEISCEILGYVSEGAVETL